MRGLSSTPEGISVQSYLKKGEMVPNDITIPILQHRIQKEFERGKKVVLLDGFPRHMAQLLDFEEQVRKNFRTTALIILEIFLALEILFPLPGL